MILIRCYYLVSKIKVNLGKFANLKAGARIFNINQIISAKLSQFNVGGQGGDAFSDFNLSGSNGYSMFNLDRRITGVGIRVGACVDAIRIK